jgi:DNA modification methylase
VPKVLEYYTDESVWIYNGNCFELINEVEPGIPDLILTDPPYDSFTHKGARAGAGADFGKLDFGPIENYSFIEKYISICPKWIVVFCPIEKLGEIQGLFPNNYVRGMIWDRINPSPQLSGDRPSQPAEGIALLHGTRKNMSWNGGGKPGIYRHSVEFGQKQHPTQKPLSLIKALVADFSDEYEMIFDPFMGSGTTLRAAKDLNRKAVGYELSAEYCRIAKGRMAQEVLQF